LFINKISAEFIYEETYQEALTILDKKLQESNIYALKVTVK